MKERHEGYGLAGIEDLMKSARKGFVYSFGGVLVLAIVASVSLRQDDTGVAGVGGADFLTSSQVAEKDTVTHHMPRTFHEMERPHPLTLLRPEPLPLASVP